MAEAFRMGTSEATIQTLLEHPDAFKEWSSPRPRKVIRVEKVQGIGSWYDEAVATGQYDPNYLTRVALGTVRVLIPDSEPTTIITYADGTREFILGGGPSSGAMGSQAAALAGFGQAIVGKRLATELAEAVVDTAAQEATGSPVGPSALKGLRPKTPESQPQSTAGRDVSPNERPGRKRGLHEQPDDQQELDDARDLTRRPLEYWTNQIEFEGKKVYQRNDLIDPKRVDDRGRTSLQRMEQG